MRTILFFCLLFASILAHAQIPAGKGEGYFCNLCNSSCDTLLFTKPGVCTHCGMQLVKQTYAERREMLKKIDKKMTIAFYLQDGVEVLDFAGPMEVFSYAGFNVFTVSRQKAPITTQGILKVMPDYSIEDAPPAEILAFFGGNAGPSSVDPAVQKWIRDSLTATTFHASIESLRTALPKTKVLENVRFVDNGHVITTAGISAGIDGALHLVSRLRGDEAARQVAAYMEYDKWIPGQGLVVSGR
jgi:transcriptional regulator GlxA family with amidase domain